MRRYHTLVLGAQRPGIVNVLAEAAGVSHKCIMPVGGRPLIEHVLEALSESDCVDRISISIDDASALDDVPLVQSLIATGKVQIIEAADNIYDSVCLGAQAGGFPMMITTADNALLTPDMVSHFCDEVGESEAAVALAQKETILAKYPEGQKKFHRFKDGEYSNCNLYAIIPPSALDAAKVFQGGGQFARSRQRTLKAFGLVNAMIYRFSLLGLDSAIRRLGRRFGVKLRAVRMPFAEAPIDVDNERTQRIVNEILSERAQTA